MHALSRKRRARNAQQVVARMPHVPPHRKESRMRLFASALVLLLAHSVSAVASADTSRIGGGAGSVSAESFAGRTLDGSGNNAPHAAWGQAGTHYLRVASPSYADGVGHMVSGPSPRYISNRIFNDVGQNLFSENDISQWGWAWGQFLDHDIGLRDERRAESADMPYDRHDKLEAFSNDVGTIAFSRTPAAPGTGSS